MERIEKAANEIQPVLEEFIVWAEKSAPEANSELMGPVALWHRLGTSDSIGDWTTTKLRTVLLDLFPKAVEDPATAASSTIPSVRAYLTFLSTTGRLTGDPLDELLAELKTISPEFGRVIFGLADDLEGEDEDIFGDWDVAWDAEPSALSEHADELRALPMIRMAPLPELAAAARATPLLQKVRDHVMETADEYPSGDFDEDLWQFAENVGFYDPPTGLNGGATEWPTVDDAAAVRIWSAGLHMASAADPAWVDELAEDFHGIDIAILTHLLLAGGRTRRDDLQEAMREWADDRAVEAWAAQSDPLGTALAPLIAYSAVEVADEEVRLTPLGVRGIVDLAEDEDTGIDARPALESMTGDELVDLSLTLPDGENEPEVAAWLAVRSPEVAARELLEAAKGDDVPTIARVQAMRLLVELGPPAEEALRAALDIPTLRPYATVQGVGERSTADVQWLTLDMWKITLDLDDEEFVSALGPQEDLISTLDDVAKLDHPDLIELLEAVARVHPDKKVAKAARRNLFRARSRASAR